MDKLFITILNMSLTGAFVIAVICAVRLPLKKAPKIISYCLWSLAGFRLLFPFSAESVLSLMPFNAQPIPSDIAMQAIPRINSGVAFVNNSVSGMLPPAAPDASVNPLQIWTAVGAYVWMLGVAGMVIYGIVSYIMLKRKMRNAVWVEADIYEADNIGSPFLLGIINPKIYLPVGLSEREREYVLLHERTHLRRRDYLVKFFACFILCLHWFNPLSWVAFLLMGADMEMSCDERVLKKMGNDTKKDYSLSLLTLATERRIISGSPLAFGEGSVKQRIKNVLNFKKPSRLIVVVSVALVSVLGVGFAVNRASGNDVGESKLPERLGYTAEVMQNILDNRTVFSDDNEHIAAIVKSLPLQADRKYSSYSLANGNEINITYEFDYDNPYRGGNGLDPYPETVRENNALLLFASVSGLEKVNFLHLDELQNLNHTDSYTMESLTARMGEITPLQMDFDTLHRYLAANIQISEFYFAHYSRIYLGAEPEEVSYRNGEPSEIIRQEDGSDLWIYSDFGAAGHTEKYYFNSQAAISNDNLTGLYATVLDEDNGESYDSLTEYLGNPSVSETMEDGSMYIAYPLREGQQRHAYFILNNGRITAQGLMYGTDWTTLKIGDSTETSKLAPGAGSAANNGLTAEEDIYSSNMDVYSMTLDDVRELAQKGEALLFEDFKPYRGVNVSSNTNRYLMLYSVEGGYRLIVNSADGISVDRAGLESIWQSSGSGIDIRYNDVDEFIAANPSHPVQPLFADSNS